MDDLDDALARMTCQHGSRGSRGSRVSVDDVLTWIASINVLT